LFPHETFGSAPPPLSEMPLVAHRALEALERLGHREPLPLQFVREYVD
jgi:hypothetical protein